MKRALFVNVLICLSMTLVYAQSAATRHPPMHHKNRPSGGLVEKQHLGKVFRVLNVQNDFKWEKLVSLTATIRHRTLLPIECVMNEKADTTDWLKLATSLVAQHDVGAGVLVLNDSQLPVEVVSPDGRWGVLNIAPLKADNPSSETFEIRFVKVYWGIISRTLGAGTSSFPGCVLVPFTNIKELDAIRATQLCPEPYNKMIDTGKSYGIEVLTITTYRVACQQGWAPAPTNDVQKAIWEEVHSIPDKPIKIEFDPKKDK